MKGKIQADLEVVQKVALTMDGWTSRAQDRYLGVTPHYFKSGKLESAVLDCSVLAEGGAAAKIAERVMEIMDEWNLDGKVLGIVTVNGANMISACDLLGIPNLRCAAHFLNLCVTDAFRASDGAREVYDHLSTIVSHFK